ncbi:hypothetical protein, partial [Luteimonas fraxinea]|uniref:hypothetical protein n=1 Tax=Luteimonas fraxinea TaxID=2901869 RepID=UPI001E547479
ELVEAHPPCEAQRNKRIDGNVSLACARKRNRKAGKLGFVDELSFESLDSCVRRIEDKRSPSGAA